MISTVEKLVEGARLGTVEGAVDRNEAGRLGASEGLVLGFTEGREEEGESVWICKFSLLGAIEGSGEGLRVRVSGAAVGVALDGR